MIALTPQPRNDRLKRAIKARFLVLAYGPHDLRAQKGKADPENSKDYGSFCHVANALLTAKIKKLMYCSLSGSVAEDSIAPESGEKERGREAGGSCPVCPSQANLGQLTYAF